MVKHEIIASEFINAIRELASKPENMNNLESYLSYHFETWLKKYGTSPENLTDEIKHFAQMEV